MECQLERIFERPPDEYIPVPWWAWTGSLDPALMKKQLHAMHEQGLREFFIFPIYGMDVEYMSAGYLERVETVLKWCRKLGMKVWIYDEYAWPSGTAGGLVARRHPDAVAANLHIEKYSGAGASEIEKLLSDSSVLHVASILPDGSVRALSQTAPSGLDKADVIAYRRMKDQTANITVRGSVWSKGEPGMLDVLSRSACRAFIEEAYEPIAEHFAEHLGRTIKGFFTDEPQIAPGAVPWTDGLADRFRARYGYDLLPLLHDLNAKTQTSEQTRVDFWTLVGDMFADAYTSQIADWCAERGLLLTGHMVYEEDSSGVWHAGDIPKSLRRMHIPGCDLLSMETSFDPPSWWYVKWGTKALIKAPKNASSSARSAGRDRVMCEAYGVAPWSKTMADEKRMTDWLSALGVNLFNDNSLIAGIAGFRKRAISGKHFTQPWWPHARLSYAYAGRLSAVSANTELDTGLLVLYPATTWQALTVRGEETSEELRRLEIALDDTLDALVRRHWDFEFVYDDVLAHAEVRDGLLTTDHGDFAGIILAGVSRLRPDSAARLEELRTAGAHIFLVGCEPRIIGQADGEPLFPGAQSLEVPPDQSFANAVDEMLEGRIGRKWRVTGKGADGTVSAARIAADGRSMLFLANMTPGAKDLNIRWTGDWEVEFRDASSGERWKPSQTPSAIDLYLPEDESVWIVQATANDLCAGTEPPAHFLNLASEPPVLELSGPWRFSLDRPNLCKLEVKLLPDPDGRLAAGSGELSSDEGWVQVNEGDAGMPLEPESMKRYWLKAEFTMETAVTNLTLVADSSDTEELYVNGEPAGKPERLCVWDEENVAWQVGRLVRPGANSLLMRVRTSPYNARSIAIFPTNIVEPVVLRGDFRVSEEHNALTRVPPQIEVGDWRAQGFPHFVGTGIYEQSFTWNGPSSDAIVALDAGRDLVEVVLDGRSLGCRAWGPRRFRADKLAPGRHSLQVRVTNTLGTILRRGYWGAEVLAAPPSGLLSPLGIYDVRRLHRC